MNECANSSDWTLQFVPIAHLHPLHFHVCHIQKIDGHAQA